MSAQEKAAILVNNVDPLKNIRVVLTRPSHPGNIGAAARAMKTMGLCDLHLVKPRTFPHAEAEARSSGALDVLRGAVVHEELRAAIGDCSLAVATTSRHRELRHECVDCRSAARALVNSARSRPVAIVFGNEATGLTSEEAALCQLWAYIPANPDYASLNLAAAVQVFAYEIRMAGDQRGDRGLREFPDATLAEVEALYVHLEQSMVSTGFFDPGNPKRLPQRLRRLLAKARLETEEVNILRGFLGSIDRLRR